VSSPLKPIYSAETTTLALCPATTTLLGRFTLSA
jgi:hypothetical protein